MLFLDVDGLTLRLKINQFRENLPGESEYHNWCKMDFSVLRNGVHIYHNYKDSPWLTCDEIKSIRDTVAGIMDGSITQNTRLGFIESDIELEFLFYDGKFSCVEMSLYYWAEGELTANRLVLCMHMHELEELLYYLQVKTCANYDKGLLEQYSAAGIIKTTLDKLSFKVIDGQLPPGEMPKRVVGIFINERELLDIVADLENENLKDGHMEYIHQTATELYTNLVPVDDEQREWQEEHGVEILSCTCGIIEDGSPAVFIEKDERYVFWKALGHNQIDYHIPLKYVFDRKQYEQALEELKKFAEDRSIY